ncbi:MAG: hypothetical protein ABS75_29810 [Pelagibacterium sp. SCN 63-23]|nr:MAG: hypothetical protein ABS75_29810 [Pelagibacterium sp. SCN 63-23]
MRAWTDILPKYGITAQQQFCYVTGKNAADIVMVIDAMDLLHSGRFDGFCLVSSDSDFTRLAARLREQGVDVFGFGKQKTPESCQQTCDHFIHTETPRPPAKQQNAPSPRTPKDAIPLPRRAIGRSGQSAGQHGTGF